MSAMFHPAMVMFITSALAIATVPIYTASQSPQRDLPAVSAAVEEFAALPGPRSENLFEAPDGSFYITDRNVVWKVTPERRVETFATITEPSVAFLVGIAGSDRGFAITTFGRPFFRQGTPPGEPRRLNDDVEPKVLLLDRSGNVTDVIVGQPGQAFNGITPVGTQPDLYLIADSQAGTIWQLDATAKRLQPWLRDDLIAPVDTAALVVGANGIKVRNGWVYVNCNSREALYRIRMGPDGRPQGNLTLVANGIFTDDFDIAPDGTVYLSSLTKISPRGEVSPFREKVPTGPAAWVSRDGKWLYWPTRGSDAKLLRTALN